MNKADLVEEVRRELGAKCSKAHAERAVNSVLQAIGIGLRKDSSVQLVGFGTFLVKQRPARTYRNPRSGEQMEVGPSQTVAFKVGSGLKSAAVAETGESSAPISTAASAGGQAIQGENG